MKDSIFSDVLQDRKSRVITRLVQSFSDGGTSRQRYFVIFP